MPLNFTLLTQNIILYISENSYSIEHLIMIKSYNKSRSSLLIFIFELFKLHGIDYFYTINQNDMFPILLNFNLPSKHNKCICTIVCI